jgi:transposase-like protein
MKQENTLHCSDCKTHKTLDNFFYNERQYSKRRHYYSYLCKDCQRNRNNKYNDKRKEGNIDVEKQAKTILTKLGYDIESDIPVHIQFKERWGL